MVAFLRRLPLILFEVFRVPFFLAAAQDEDYADRCDKKRNNQQDDAHYQTGEGDVFGVRLKARRIKCAYRNYDKNDA
jgi:hypothetical protein